MIDIFVSHVEEDRALVEELAHAIESQGYSTWYYERDSVPGTPFLLTIARVIAESRALLLVVSRASLDHGHQVTTEVFQAYEGRKRFFPLLVDVGFEEYHDRQPEWHIAAAGSVAVALPPGGVPAVVPSLVRGLQEAGIAPSGAPRAGTDDLDGSLARVRTLLNAPDRLTEAGPLLDEVLAHHPRSPDVHRLRGEYANRLFRHEDAVTAFEEAARLDPSSALAQWDLALAYLQCGREDEARRRLVRALRQGLDQSRQRHAMLLLARLPTGRPS